MATLRNLEGIRLNQNSGANANYGSRIYTSTRTWSAYASGVNMIQMVQNGATSSKQIVSIDLRWAAIRTSDPKTELPVLYATARLALNTNGTITHEAGLDWQSWGGNGILWPYAGMGGSSFFLGANSGSSTGIIGSVWICVCTYTFNNLTINIFSD